MTGPCDAVVESVSARLDGEEAPLAVDVVAAHLATCAACDARAGAITAVASAEPARLAVAARLPDDLRVAATAVAPSIRRRPTGRWRPRMAVAAAVAAPLLGAGVLAATPAPAAAARPRAVVTTPCTHGVPQACRAGACSVPHS